jgi:uncharacterized glyoxalase superfamily protein PhnB
VILACSHLVVATEDVPRLTRFFESVFESKPYFENEMFSEFVLPNGFRVAFFKPVGASARFFSAKGERGNCAFGVTVKDVDATYARVAPILVENAASSSGPPKEHSWGQKSFLLLDPDGNRWEIAQTPTPEGMLKNQ